MMYEPGSQAKETPGLEDYLAALRQRKLLVLACALLGLALAIVFSISRTETWEASSKVLANPTNVGTIDGRLVSPVLEREREIVTSNAVAQSVIDQLDLGTTTTPGALLRDLDVVFVPDSDTLEILYVHPDAEQAKDRVNSFAVQYVAKRNAEATELDDSKIAELQATVDTLSLAIDELDAEIARLDTARSRVPGTDEAASLGVQLTGLRTQRNTFLQDLRTPRSDLLDAQLAKNTRTLPAEVLQLATIPDTPTGFGNNIIRFLGLFLGTGLGAALAFVLHRLDRTARETGDVELALGTSVLASIPSFGMANRGGSAAIVMLTGGKSARIQRAREAFRRLRSSVQFLGTTRDAGTFLITSARPAEGKSTTSANLAIALAQGETKVCLVNADLRRPTIEKVLGIPSTQLGLGDWLADQSITNIMVPVPGASGLVVVPSGPPSPNPGELFATNRFSDLMAELSGQFDIVLVDAPPVLSAADASTISRAVDGTIIVVDSSRTDTDTLLKVRAEIDRAGGTVVGAVLNRDKSDTGGGVLRKDRYAYEKVTAARSGS